MQKAYDELQTVITPEQAELEDQGGSRSRREPQRLQQGQVLLL